MASSKKPTEKTEATNYKLEDMDFVNMSYREVQLIAMNLGFKGNLKRQVLIRKIRQALGNPKLKPRPKKHIKRLAGGKRVVVNQYHNHKYAHRGFTPTAKQVELVKAFADPEVKPTITAVCKKIGISRRAYYDWLENDDFVKWYDYQWAKLMKRNKSYLDNIGLKKAPSDFRYWEAMQMMYHDYKRKQDVTTDDQPIKNINISDLNNLSYEELQKFASEQNRVAGESKNG